MRFAIHGREVAVPKLVGMTPQQAQQALASQGLTLVRENRYFSSEVPEGRVLSQLPRRAKKYAVAGACVWPKAWARSARSSPASLATANALPN